MKKDLKYYTSTIEAAVGFYQRTIISSETLLAIMSQPSFYSEKLSFLQTQSDVIKQCLLEITEAPRSICELIELMVFLHHLESALTELIEIVAVYMRLTNFFITRLASQLNTLKADFINTKNELEKITGNLTFLEEKKLFRIFPEPFLVDISFPTKQAALLLYCIATTKPNGGLMVSRKFIPDHVLLEMLSFLYHADTIRILAQGISNVSSLPKHLNIYRVFLQKRNDCTTDTVDTVPQHHPL